MDLRRFDTELRLPDALVHRGGGRAVRPVHQAGVRPRAPRPGAGAAGVLHGGAREAARARRPGPGRRRGSTARPAAAGTAGIITGATAETPAAETPAPPRLPRTRRLGPRTRSDLCRSASQARPARDPARRPPSRGHDSPRTGRADQAAHHRTAPGHHGPDHAAGPARPALAQNRPGHADRRHARRGQRQHDQLLHRPRHRRADEAHLAPPPGRRAARARSSPGRRWPGESSWGRAPPCCSA